MVRDSQAKFVEYAGAQLKVVFKAPALDPSCVIEGVTSPGSLQLCAEATHHVDVTQLVPNRLSEDQDLDAVNLDHSNLYGTLAWLDRRVHPETPFRSTPRFLQPRTLLIYFRYKNYRTPKYEYFLQ